ncbi:MAG TPA: MerR family transcriptional regulator [Paracoccaceae bacterium]|nr:MerR family transcriptional regulator [Paracoccaceae bacterium]
MTLTEQAVVAHIERLTLRELRIWVREGWVRPAQDVRGPVFDDLDLARIRLLCDLRKDMAVPNDAMPVVLTLIDHLHRTRRELRRVTQAVDEQPDDIRKAIIRAFRQHIDDDELRTEDLHQDHPSQ